MDDLQELYQSVILDHNRLPRNYRSIDGAHCVAEGNNPLCGDQLKVWATVEGDRVADVSFLGSGCAISKASASLMTGAVKGKTLAEAEALADTFHRLVTGRLDRASAKAELGKLAVFSGVSEFPARVKCASLSWHTLKAALARSGETVSTE